MLEKADPISYPMRLGVPPRGAAVGIACLERGINEHTKQGEDHEVRLGGKDSGAMVSRELDQKT